MKYNSQTGWIDGIRHCHSPNFDDRPEAMPIELLVIHGISLPPKEYGGEYIDQLFTNTLQINEHPYFESLVDLKVSTHLLVRRCGELVQYVSLKKRAWHAGLSQFRDRNRCNDFSIGIELEGCDDQAYEAIQYRQLAKLSRLIQQEWPAIATQNIVGHCDIAPGRKTDPGENFDWVHYRDLLSNSG